MVADRSRRRVALLALLAGLVLGLVGVAPVRAVGLTWTVDSLNDAPDAKPADLFCRTLVGTCSLRAAIMQANAHDPGPGNHHTINVPAGTITMVVMGPGEDNAAQGDYDIKRSVTIRGEGPGDTIIQGSTTSALDAFDRIFDVQALGAEFVLENLTVRRGNSNISSGGAIRVQAASASIALDNVTLTQNRAFDEVGAAIFARSGPLTIVDSRINSNDSVDGPVVYVDGGNLTIRRTTFANNDVFGGTVLLRGDGTGLIDRSVFYGNEANGPTALGVRVGANNDDVSSLTVRNSTFARNVGEGESTVLFGDRGATLTVESTTIAGNTAFGISGGAGTSIRNTILSGNDRGNCLEPVTSLGHNLDTNFTCDLDGPGDIVDGTSDLASLAGNGGPTRTRALGPDSDAIDAGSDCPDVDQRGQSRPKDGDDDGQARCDIGAYEAAAGTAATPAPTPEPTPAPTEPPPTAAPTEAPTPAPTEPPAATLAPTAVAASPGATEPTAASAGPSQGGQPVATPVPGASAAPEPADNPFGGAGLLWVVLAIAAVVVIALGLVFGLRRRRGSPPPA